MKPIELEYKSALRGLKIGKVKITKKMFKDKEEAVKAFQKRYSLKITGTVDKATAYKLKSIAASQGLSVKQIKRPTVDALQVCSAKRLSLNMVTNENNFSAVAILQKNLAYLGYKISLSEHQIDKKKMKENSESLFGKSTIKAVKAFQKDKNLPQTGIFDTTTRKVLNAKILKDRPKAKISHPYRIRGSVRDIQWRGKSGMMIEVSENPPFNKDRTITPVKNANLDNGFFDVIYDAPIDEITGAIKKPLHIVVKLYEGSNTKPVATQTHYNVSPVHWINFVQNGVNPDVYKGKYKGLSAYENIVKALNKVEGFSLKNFNIKNKEEILTLSKISTLPVNHIMTVVYAERIKEYFDDSTLKSELFYAFLVLNSNFSDNFLKSVQNVPKTVENLAIEIALLDETIKKELIADAIKQNIVSQQIKINTNFILKALSTHQIEYTLSKNILVGGVSLNLLLGLSKVEKSDHTKIALAYILTHEFSKTFWKEISKILNKSEIKNFYKVVEIADMVDNDKELRSLFSKVDKASDVAKLSKNEIGEKILIKAEQMYPAVALISNIKKNTLPQVTKLETFIDNNNKFNLLNDNIDEYIHTNSIQIPDDVKKELKIVQRVHRITTNAKLAVKLLKQNIHNAHQIYGMGKARLSEVLDSTPEEVDKIYASAKMRYMQVTTKVLEYKELLGTHGFSVIATPQLDNIEDDKKANLDTLFGSMDYCECEHCQSLYGPTAYLTDILHFLNQQAYTGEPNTVKDPRHFLNQEIFTAKDVLFERRADMGMIELSCENTWTPVPYIDLVCEILENYILKIHNKKDKNWLYSNVIGNTNYTMGNSFDLNTEQIESYLNYLQVPRYTLMETFDTEEIEVAMSFFGIRGKEENRIIGSNNASDFMQKTGLSYKELLLLVQVNYLGKFAIENEGCTLEKQVLKNVVPKKIDSFIRLWRHTSWEMEELDLLIMHKDIGEKDENDKTIIGNKTLINLKYIKQIQDMLGLSVEHVLYFFEDNNSMLKPYMQDFFFFLEKIKYYQSPIKFTEPKMLFEALKEFNDIQSSPLSLLELEYCLNNNSDSVIGLRKETITQMIDELSEILKTSKDIELSIKMHIAQSFDLEQKQASILIDSNQELLERFKKIESTENIEEDYRILHRNVLLISKMTMEPKVLTWFINNFSVVDTFNFNIHVNDFKSWHNLYTFLTFKNSFPEPENASLVEILTLARDGKSDESKKMIADLTQRNVGDILDGNYKEASFYQQLLIGFAQEKVLNVGLKKMKHWAKTSDKDTVEKIGKLIDKKNLDLIDNTIREKKRTALVEYLILYSQKNDTLPTWSDSTSLYKYFLIDVEMNACQMTSRVKQALSSIQLFVQRCFLNLEENIKITKEQKEDKSSKNSWSQWKWMKNYRVWEANRKIFFYPENWIEPELRDDKTEIFKTLENALMQNEISDNYAEEVFKSYLHEMDELSDLEVSALYHEKEDFIDMVHVIARTKAIPSIYYYRTYDMNYSRWSSWEKIDGEIDGDTLVPVVYNRKLHLFWLQFMEKPIKSKKIPEAQPSNEPTDAPEALKVLEIQLVWSVKDFNGWSSKKISNQKLIHPWSRPKFSYLLKPNYKADENELFINIYLSTSKEFNNTTFYDPEKTRNENPVYKTDTRFNETYRPWHSSSFVFDGNVKEVRIKGLGNPTWNPNLKDSYDKIYQNFEEDGRAMIKFANEHEDSLKLPRGMHYHYNYLTNNSTNVKSSNELKLLSDRYDLKLWKEAPKSFRLIVSQQDVQLDIKNKLHPFFYQDSKRAFFIEPNKEPNIEPEKEYKVTPFHHPYTTLFMRELNRDGVKGLFNRDLQVSPESYVSKNSMSDTVDFSLDGANAIYNWELFFHAPLMIANRLMQNQKFEEAMKWFHYIFNPSNIDNADSPQRFWITKPFNETSDKEYQEERINTLLSNINNSNDQLNAWKNNPFNPHIIANYRTVAYQKNVVMKYIDNLIAWGDMLFRRDSMESINEASLLYMLAYEILGKRPTEIKKKDEDTTHNYDDLEDKLNEISNAIENTVSSEKKIIDNADSAPLPMSKSSCFCTPHNEQIAQYWDKVEDRLFKIRHCMNIKGMVRQLPLFQPPIDPALLVKATASGMDIAEVLNNIADSSVPTYRFRVTLQKAIEFTNDLKQYGDKLLSILEKKDAESLAFLRSEHETQLLETVTDIRKRQVEEAKEQIKVLQKNKASIEERHSYYSNIEKITSKEQLNLDKLEDSMGFQMASQLIQMIAGTVGGVPDFTVGAAGFGGSPVAVTTSGGASWSSVLSFASNVLSMAGNITAYEANRASILGGYGRRYDDWKLQENLAKRELDSMDSQIIIAEIRKDIAQKELKNHNKQIENAKSINSYMKDKFTNKELYNWMTNQVSTLYFQAYELAYSMAKKAEKSYNYELGTESSNIIQGGYWDSLHKGLLSGDKLMSDLRKLDETYMEKNKRGFEITKHISLAQIFPEKLLELKTEGNCIITLPEWLFDIDYPNHYMRRIKSISLSIPCIVGPYTSINCTLTLNESSVRKSAEEDLSLSARNPDNASIVTSSGQNDSGMFELNFHDERYLPFEGAGVVNSEWKIEMPKEHNYFDFNSLSDVIMHINYVALADTNPDNTRDVSTEMNVLFNLKDNFPTEWHRLKNDTNFDSKFEIKPEHLPFILRPKINSLTIKKEYSEINKQIEELSEEKHISVLLDNTITINKSDISDEIENIYIIIGEN